MLCPQRRKLHLRAQLAECEGPRGSRYWIASATVITLSDESP